MSLELLESLNEEELQELIVKVRALINKRYYDANRDEILRKKKEKREKEKRLKC